MKKFYYFSPTRLQFVEIRNAKLKMFLSGVGIFITASLIVGAGFWFYNSFLNPNKNLAQLRNENLYLRNKLQDVSALYTGLNGQIDSLIAANNELRIAANLPALSEDEKKLGIGGNSFGNLSDVLNLRNNDDIKKSLQFMDEVTRKFEFQRGNLEEVRYALKNNQSLYRAIPAIKPCNGVMALHGYGMRMHPILGVYRMHEGIDIITDVGTPVASAADGVVDFVGSKNGFGLVVEIDHGFGYRTVYGHLSRTEVREGQKIKRGSLIAKTGNSGLSAGPHLHYEVLHNGANVNPAEFFFDDMYLFDSLSKK